MPYYYFTIIVTIACDSGWTIVNSVSVYLRKNYVIGLNLLRFDDIIISKSERHLKGWKRTKRQ